MYNTAYGVWVISNSYPLFPCSTHKCGPFWWFMSYCQVFVFSHFRYVVPCTWWEFKNKIKKKSDLHCFLEVWCRQVLRCLQARLHGCFHQPEGRSHEPGMSESFHISVFITLQTFLHWSGRTRGLEKDVLYRIVESSTLKATQPYMGAGSC